MSDVLATNLMLSGLLLIVSTFPVLSGEKKLDSYCLLSFFHQSITLICSCSVIRLDSSTGFW